MDTVKKNIHDIEYFGAEKVISDELDSIRKQRPSSDTDLRTQDLFGLSLSGGGIRSASFSLGVMQALAYNGWLAKIDYLSTVSGGGYIGSSLTWALNSCPVDFDFGLSRDNFPFASFPMSGEAREVQSREPIKERLRTDNTQFKGRLLNFLRQNATYLTPGGGLNLFTLVWIALRGAGLGLVVYGALITIFFLTAFSCNVLHEVRSIPLFPQLLPILPSILKQNWLLFWATLGLACCILTIPIYSLATFIYHWILLEAAYPFRRIYEKVAGRVLPFFLAVLLLGIVPVVHDRLVLAGKKISTKAEEITVAGNLAADGSLSIKGTIAPAEILTPTVEPQTPKGKTVWSNLKKDLLSLWSGLSITLLGLLSGIMAFFKTKSIKPGWVPLGLMVGVGVGALLFGIVLLSYTLALAVVTTVGSNVFHASLFWYTLVATLVFALFTNINHISIHRYYRDRLMETFMPDINDVMQGEYAKAAASDRANSELMQKMKNGPYHIINTNVILAASDNPRFKVRGGDNFILSPKYCGSYATNWQKDRQLCRG